MPMKSDVVFYLDHDFERKLIILTFSSFVAILHFSIDICTKMQFSSVKTLLSFAFGLWTVGLDSFTPLLILCIP